MPFLRYANAQVVNPRLRDSGWDKVRVASGKPRMDRNLVDQASKILKAEFDPSDFLLTHATIVASVDTIAGPNTKLGAITENGKQIVRKTASYRIKATCDKYINNNLDSWARPVLLKSYSTFIGAHSFVEHVQIEELSKGRILDAVARDVGESVYIDILIANDKKHETLIRDIESKKLSTLSMGCSIDGSTCTKCGHWAADETEFCFPPGTRVLKSDGKYVPIEEIVPGDMVLTHKGNHQQVLHTMSRHYEGHVSVLTVDGVPNQVRATVNHPFWVLRPQQDCACGCGAPLRRTVEHERGAAQAFQRRFLPGHNSRVQNPNKSENVLTLGDYSRLFETNMEFTPAKDIRKGDYLTFPIPQEVRDTADATERRARLIGYFLAEGSYVKRDGERVGVEFTFGHHETDTLAAEVHDLLNIEWGHETRRGRNGDWQERVAKSGLRPIRRRVTSRSVPADVSCPDCGAPSEYAFNARFKQGREDCYTCKVCGGNWLHSPSLTSRQFVQARLYPPPVAGQGSCSVRLMFKGAADWLYRYCGEYSDGKQLHADVMLWNPEVQKHVLFGWMNGDGTQAHTGITGCTASFHLMSQMHVLAARCGWYGRKQVVFGDRVTQVDQVVNGDGTVTVRDDRGWLPQFRMYLSEPTGFGQEVKFTESDKARVTLSSFTDGFKRVGNWMLYRVRDTSVECYSGPVHNFEVEGDNSYVVEGVAVHNCDHIKYEKGNTFYGEDGQKYRVAELCGDESLDPTGGVTFIEASWVEVPAFTGAVARNVISVDAKTDPERKTAKKIQSVFDMAAPKADPNAMKKAAFDLSADMFDEDPGAEAPAEDAPAEKVPAPPSPLEGIQEDLKQFILDNVQEQLKSELQKSKIEEQVLPDSDAPNDTVIKQARASHRAGLKLAYSASLREIVASSSTSSVLLRRIAKLNQEIGLNVPFSVYNAMLKVGGRNSYPDLRQFLRAASAALGHKPTANEARTMIRLASLLEAHQNTRRRADSNRLKETLK